MLTSHNQLPPSHTFFFAWLFQLCIESHRVSLLQNNQFYCFNRLCFGERSIVVEFDPSIDIDTLSEASSELPFLQCLGTISTSRDDVL